MDAAAVYVLEVGGVGAVEAETSEGVELAAGIADGQALSEVEVLSGGTRGVGPAAALDQEVAIDAEGAGFGDDVVGGAGQSLSDGGDSAALEVAVVISEVGVVGAGVGVGLECEPSVKVLSFSSVLIFQ